MLFNSYTFFIFLALVLIISRQIQPWRARKAFLLVVSYIFYAAWNPPFVILLWISTVADWIFARRISTSPTQRTRRLFLAGSLLVNLGLLGFFKYGEFLLNSFVYGFQLLGIAYAPAAPDIILPVGISFYTFQTLSYSIDVFRKRLEPWPSFLDYALYVTFFPQLMAGPIVRATHFLPQCMESKRGTGDQMSWGLTLFVIGLFNKMVIADTLMAPIVEQVYDSTAIPDMTAAWAGASAFSIQIFCDFAGYSSCAIGVALCLGFDLPVNFRYPYGSAGFSEFWTRWHVSLSEWLRDYLYVPLGGNRIGNIRTYANLMLTMLLGGLWHGASWLFVLWGGLQGIYLAAERLLRQTRLADFRLWRSREGHVGLVLLTFSLWCLAWPLFRSRSVERATELLGAMLALQADQTGNLLSLSDFHLQNVICCTVGILVIHYLLREQHLDKLFQRIHWTVRAGLMTVLMYLTLISFTGVDRAFIYFQF